MASVSAQSTLSREISIALKYMSIFETFPSDFPYFQNPSSKRMQIFSNSCRSLSALGVAWRFHTENAPVDPPAVRDNRG